MPVTWNGRVHFLGSKGTQSSEEVKDVNVLGGKALLNNKKLNYDNSGSDSEEHMKSVSGSDESNIDDDKLSLYSDEQGYTESKAESTEDNQSHHEVQTVTHREKDSITDEDNSSLYSDEEYYKKSEAESIEESQSQHDEYEKDSITDEDNSSLNSDEEDYIKSEAESIEDGQSQHEEFTEIYKEKNSIIDEADSSLYSNEQDYLKSEVEIMKDDQRQLQEKTVTHRGEDFTKLNDIYKNNNWNQYKQGEKRSLKHDEWYNKDFHEPHWYIDSEKYHDKGSIFKKITKKPNKCSKCYYYIWPAAFAYFLKSHKGFSTTQENYVKDDIYNEHVLYDSKHMKNAAAVPVRETAAYSVNYPFPINRFDIKNTDEYPLLYRVHLHNDHHSQPLKNVKHVYYAHGPEYEVGKKLTTLSDGTLLEKDMYYNKQIQIDDPERGTHIKTHQNVFRQWAPINHNSIKAIFSSEDETTSHGALFKDGPDNFLEESKHVHLAVENKEEDSQSKKLYSTSWYKPFYSNNKIIHSDSSTVKTESKLRDGLELKKYTPSAIIEDSYKTDGYFPDKYDNSGKYTCHCYKYVDEGGLFRYHDSYMLNKHNEKDTEYKPPGSHLFLQDWSKQHSDLKKCNEVAVYDMHDSTIKYHPHLTDVFEEDKVVDYIDKQGHTKIIQEVDLKTDTLDDKIINVNHTKVDPQIGAINSDMATVGEEITEEVAHESVQECYHSADSTEEDKFFSKTQDHDHIEFVENDDLEVKTINDKIIKLKEMDITVLQKPEVYEERIETVGQESVHETHPHNTYSLKEDESFGHTECHDHTGTLNDKINKLHEIDMTVKHVPTKSEEIIEEIVGSEVNRHEIYVPKEDSITDYKENHEYLKISDKEDMEFATLNSPLIKLHKVNKLVSDKPMLTEEIVEEATYSTVKHYPQHIHAPEEDKFFGYTENHGYGFTEKEHMNIDTLNDHIINFHEKGAFATKKPIVYEGIIRELADTDAKYHPHYDYAVEEENLFDQIENDYHTEVIKNGHLISNIFNEETINPHENEKVPGIASIVLNKPMMYEEIAEEVASNPPHDHHYSYIIDEKNKAIFHHNEDHGHTEVFKTDNWKFGSVSDQTMKFHETELPLKSDLVVSPDYNLNEDIVEVPRTGSYLIPGYYQENFEISLPKDTEYDSRVTHTAFPDREHIIDAIPQSETYEINDDILYSFPFLLKEVSEDDDVETLDEDSDEIDIGIGFPFAYKKEESHVEMGHHPEKFPKTEDSIVVADHILEEADSVLVSEDIGNEVLENNQFEEDVDLSLLLERAHNKQLIDDNVAMETNLEHDAIYSLKNADIFDSRVVSAVQYDKGDKLSVYNEEMNYEVDSSEHDYDENIKIPNPSPYDYYEEYLWSNAANKNYDQHIIEDDALQEKDLMPTNVAKYDIDDETERVLINEENFKVTEDDYPVIKDISIPFSEKYGSLIKNFPILDHKIVQHQFNTREPTKYDYHYSENKYSNDQFFEEEKSTEIEQIEKFNTREPTKYDYHYSENKYSNDPFFEEEKSTEIEQIEQFNTREPTKYDYQYSGNKYSNDPLFVEEKSGEIEQVGHDYNVEKNIAVKETEFSLDSRKAAPRPCIGYRCLPFYKYSNDPFFLVGKRGKIEQVGHDYNVDKNLAVKETEFPLNPFIAPPRPCIGYRCFTLNFPLFYPHHKGAMPHWQTTSGTKYFRDLYTVPTSGNSFITTAGVKKYPWQFHKLLTV